VICSLIIQNATQASTGLFLKSPEYPVSSIFNQEYPDYLSILSIFKQRNSVYTTIKLLSHKAGRYRFIAYNILANQFIDIIYNKMKRPR